MDEWERSREHGGGAGQGLGAEHHSQVPGRGRTLWIPSAIVFIFIFLTRGNKKMDLAETPILTPKLCLI